MRHPILLVAHEEGGKPLTWPLQATGSSGGAAGGTPPLPPVYFGMPLSTFHPVVARWFTERLGSPTPAQAQRASLRNTRAVNAKIRAMPTLLEAADTVQTSHARSPA